jgi:hypothetical protein
MIDEMPSWCRFFFVYMGFAIFRERGTFYYALAPDFCYHVLV